MSEEEYKIKQPSVTINGETMQLKYCPTCKIIREPRSFHCKLCGNCIRRHDLVGNCIGKNNTDKFFYFLTATFTHAFIVLISSAIKAFTLLDKDISRSPITLAEYMFIIVTAFSGMIAALILLMLCYHMFLISKNTTTNEYVRGMYKDKLFDEGCGNNWRQVFRNKDDGIFNV